MGSRPYYHQASFYVIPAQAGIQAKSHWIPAFAGMTAVRIGLKNPANTHRSTTPR